LKIDPEKTGDDKVWIGSALVPLVCLENGEVLIPASKYQDGARLLEQRKPNHRRGGGSELSLRIFDLDALRFGEQLSVEGHFLVGRVP